MRRITGFLAFLLALPACGRPPAPGAAADVSAEAPPGTDERAQYAAWVSELSQAWLDRGTVPSPVVSFAPQSATDGGLVVTVAPGLPEDQAWNAWPDGTARLFNDGIGYLWRVSIASDRAVRWSPAHTQLAVNDTDQTFLPVVEPDELLVHLLRGAALETRAGGPPNLSLRIRNADEFRRAYLGTEPTTARDAVVVFPAPSRTLQAVAMELTLGLWVEGSGVRQYRFLFE
ncbi:MAG: hypothetical protein ACK4YP_12015 [Myxococcota bacterium]